ncbi:hypothetical protein EVAR_86_1 [Eumeta japonica]|uniref:Uncharacterized protein n=1 Tax=Eumeta variegata TaxID=151549 RepID=A0A4C1SB89_EUMVA|nr:hypothetical protein EVAR_86_1 [Eumeta japonica]
MQATGEWPAYLFTTSSPPMDTPRLLVVTAAHVHSQPQWSHQYVAGPSGRIRISDEGGINEEGVSCTCAGIIAMRTRQGSHLHYIAIPNFRRI